MKEAVELMREVAMHIANKTIAEYDCNRLCVVATALEQEMLKQKDKLEFMVEMTKLDHNIDMDDNGEFKSESTNAMFVGWMAKVNKENK